MHNLDLIERILQGSIEYDLNPLIIFDKNAKVIRYNQEAEFLLSYESSKKLFELAVNYAPINYGYKTSFINIELNRVKYYAILVGYENEDYLLLKLYKELYLNSFHLEKKNISKVSIYTLLELALKTNLDLNSIKVDRIFDPSIPQMNLKVKSFMQLLNYILKKIKEEKCDHLKVEVFIKVAQNIVIDGKKYPVCAIAFSSSELCIKEDSELKRLALDSNVVLIYDKNRVILEFALIS